jgi:NADH:ubiquinone oxidoreductase subunit 6 (subunit J)
MKQKISHWIPMGFCAVLALISLPLVISFKNTGWAIPFLCFLPMCFFFVAAVTSNLQREVRDLREQVARLHEKRAGSQDAA